MRRDSGLFIVGLAMFVLGMYSCLKGFKGESIDIMTEPPPTAIWEISAVGTIVMGICMVVGGALFIRESGFFRGKK